MLGRDVKPRMVSVESTGPLRREICGVAYTRHDEQDAGQDGGFHDGSSDLQEASIRSR